MIDYETVVATVRRLIDKAKSSTFLRHATLDDGDKDWLAEELTRRLVWEVLKMLDPQGEFIDYGPTVFVPTIGERGPEVVPLQAQQGEGSLGTEPGGD